MTLAQISLVLIGYSLISVALARLIGIPGVMLTLGLFAILLAVLP